MDRYLVSNEAQLRELMGDPVHELIHLKSASRITAPMLQFIQMSPFLCIATHGPEGDTDVSPRGDAPGFVQLLDENTLVIPERPGNKRLDSVVNIIRQPQLALLFMIPGTGETLRVNGRGKISTDPELLELFEVNGKLPKLCIVVDVEEAFGHCSKAFRRAKLWEDDYRPTGHVPTLAEMMGDHLELDADTTTMLEGAIEDDAVNNLY